VKDAQQALDSQVAAKYARLTTEEIKTVVTEGKWLLQLAGDVQSELDHVSQTLSGRIWQLAERYKTPLPQMVSHVAELEAKVSRHLEQMGFSWK
jgi:type I restriction enzyme M protein